MRFVIKGKPAVLKNSKEIVRTSEGRTFIKSNPRVEAYQHDAVAQLCSQKWEQTGQMFVFSCPVHVCMIFYGAWKRGAGNVPDLSNLYQMPEDLLEQAGVIENDRQIESHDGSRRIYMCDHCVERPWYKSGPNKGKRKPDCGAIKRCPHEKVEIEVNAVVE